MILTNSKERERFLRFAFVGVFGAVVDFGSFNLMSGVFKIPAVLASVISFSLAVVSNFIWNRFWTYPDSRTKRLSFQLTQFTIISAIGLAIRTPLFAFLEPRMTRVFNQVTVASFLSSTFLGHNVSLAIAVVVVMMWNFFANRFWTYSDVPSS